MTGSPISDLNPIFMAAGVKLNLCSLKRGNRTIPMDHTFFVGYRRNVVLPEEVLVSIDIPFSKQVISRNSAVPQESLYVSFYLSYRINTLSPISKRRGETTISP